MKTLEMDDMTEYLIDESYLEEYCFGSDSEESVLLFVVATLVEGDGQCLSNSKRLMAQSMPGDTSSMAGQKFHDLINSLSRHFDDDDCDYGCEYYEGAIYFPLRFVCPAEGAKNAVTANFEWHDSEGETHKGLCYVDSASGSVNTAFFISLERAKGNLSGYELYLRHVKDYLCLPSVKIIAYSDAVSSLKLVEYSAGRYVSKIAVKDVEPVILAHSISPREMEVLNQRV
jgi:hypothetical protein